MTAVWSWVERKTQEQRPGREILFQLVFSCAASEMCWQGDNQGQESRKVQTDRQTDRQTERQTDRQTDTQTDR